MPRAKSSLSVLQMLELKKIHNIVLQKSVFHMQARDLTQSKQPSKRIFQVYGCVATCQDMVEHLNRLKSFNKVRTFSV